MHRNSDRMLWMGDLERYMDGNFIGDGFKKLGIGIVSVKIVMDKYDGHRAGYCFVEMPDVETARDAMLNVNGKIIPNSRPPVKFNLSFANNPSAGVPEYNLFVNNLPEQLGDAELYQVFGKKYNSCRGAKVYRNPDGTCRGMGFVRFGDETDQQRALVEMNRQNVYGRPLSLKLAPVRIKGSKYGRQREYDPGTYYPQHQDFYNSSNWQMYDYHQQGGKPSSSDAGLTSASVTSSDRRSGGGSRKSRSEFTDPDSEPYDDFVDNDQFMIDSEDLHNAIFDSSWFPSVHTASVTFDDM